MHRITDKDLNAVNNRINIMTGSPMEPYSQDSDGKWKPNANNYHLSGAYGGKSLHRMSADQGCTGVHDVFSCGHVPKKELFYRMHAFINGINAKLGAI